MTLPTTLAGMRALAYHAFRATTREAAVAQYLIAAYDNRRFAHDQGRGPRSIVFRSALYAVRRAIHVARAEDWEAAYLSADGWEPKRG